MGKLFESDFGKVLLTFGLSLFFLSLWTILSYYARDGIPVLSNFVFKMVLTLVYIPIFLVESLPKYFHNSPLAFAIYFFIFLVYSYIVSTIIFWIYGLTKKYF